MTMSGPSSPAHAGRLRLSHFAQQWCRFILTVPGSQSWSPAGGGVMKG